MNRIRLACGGAAAIALALSAAIPAQADNPRQRMYDRANNTAVVDQAGRGLEAAIVQSGVNNDATIAQRGINNSGFIGQDGSNHTACLVQVGRGLDASIAQTGDGASTGVFQTRHGVREFSPELCANGGQALRGAIIRAQRRNGTGY